LNGFSHTDPEDLAFQLIAPNGSTNLVFMSGTDGYNQATNTTLTFSDAASNLLADYGDDPVGNPKPSGTFRPTSATTADSSNQSYTFTVTPNFSAPRGSNTLNGTFAGLSGSNLNGTWKLYITDSFGSVSGDSGSLSAYSITFTTTVSSVGTTTTVSTNPSQVFTTSPGNTATITATVTATGSPVTSGTVGFTDNGTAISGESAVPVNVSGQASFVYTAPSTEGAHTIVATYSGATGDLASNGQTSIEVDNHPTVNGSQICNGPITLGPVNQGSSPYGSRLYVPSSFSGSISAVTLSLDTMTSPDESSFALALASPSGAKYLVPMNEIGFNSGSIFSLSGTNIQLSDSAGASMPSGAQLNSGTFLPSAYLNNGNLTAFPSPVPALTASNYAAPTGTSTFASTFGGLDTVGTAPNNYWELFVTNTTGQTGSIGKWCLSFVTSTAPASTTTVTSSKDPSFVGDSVTFTATVTSGGNPVTQGTVTLMDGSTTLQGPTAPSGTGTVTFTTSSLTEGSHTITASYSGAPGVANVSTGTLTQEVDNHTVISNGGLTFCNPGTITLPNQSSTGTPYPSRIFVSNVPGTVSSLSVALNGFTRNDPSGTAVLLAGPQMQMNSQPENLILFSEAGDNNGAGGAFSVNNVNLVFQDGHTALPQFAQIVSGTYGTSDYTTFGAATFPSPAPATVNTTGTLNGEFGSSNPNGTWQLFPATPLQGTGDGTIGNWCLTFAENAPSLTVTKTASGSFAQASTTGQFTISVANAGPGATGGPNPVTVTDNLPAGMKVTAISANNWSCTTTLPAASIACSRSDALAAGSSYPDNIVLTVSVPASATPGTPTNTATVAGGGSASNTSGNAMVTVTQTPAAVTVVSGTPQSATIGMAFSNPLVATVKDGAGNPVLGVTVTFTAPSTGASVIFASTGNNTATAVTNSSGQAISPGFAANGTPGASYTVTASAVGATSANFTLTNNAPPPSLSLSKVSTGTFTQGQTGEWDLSVTNLTSNGPTTSAVTVIDTLPSGYTVANFATTAGTWSCSGAGTATATCVTTSTGLSTFPVIRIVANIPANSPVSVTNTAVVFGGGDLTHTNSSNGFPTSNTVSVTQTPASIAVVSGTPQSAVTGAAFQTPLVVVVKDAAGAAVSGVTVTFTAPASGASGTFSSTGTNTATASTAANGQATSPTFTANAIAGGPYSVSATAPGAGFTSFSLTNTAAAVQVTFSTSPAGLFFIVDGTTYSATTTLSLAANSSHNISTSSPQINSTNLNNFNHWSDGGAIAHSITVPSSATTFTAFFDTSVNVSSSVTVTGSGLIYNRVAKLFNGTITITNIGGGTIAGPLQLGLINLPAGVTLANATVSLGGNPYITIPGTLAAGQSVTVPVQFSDPSSANIGYQTVVFSGAF
jgi:uncharacterized repeat protein (TIGR01451 family)